MTSAHAVSSSSSVPAGARWRVRLGAALSQPRDLASLAAFRVAFGTIVMISALRFLCLGWIEQLFVMPRFHFKYWALGWVPAPSPTVAWGLFATLAVLGALVALGLAYRVSVALLFVVFTYLQLVDVATYLNHYYLVSLLALLLTFMPAHRCFSVDARLRPTLRADTGPAWCLWLLRAQVGIVYVNAGLAKATADWLLHAQPLDIWLSARTSMPVVGPFLDHPAVAYLMSWAGFLFDTTIVLWLLWPRTRRWAYGAVLVFHASTWLLFPPIGMFPVIMVVAALVFFGPAWPRRWLPPRTGDAGLVVRSSGGTSTWVGAAMAGAFLILQLAAPLRAHAYGGNVSWHEQGMRFSWRVMTREKNGSVTFVVRDPVDGREWLVPPGKYLTRIQEREMAVQPDLILQLARRIARDWAAAGHPGVRVFADARVSLNGRPAEPFIDPDVDLARETDGVGAKAWILPAPAAAPPLLRRVVAVSP
jgi:vitamin K-dependent gamma-carboxylase